MLKMYQKNRIKFTEKKRASSFFRKRERTKIHKVENVQESSKTQHHQVRSYISILFKNTLN